jgi:hypothetical protein
MCGADLPDGGAGLGACVLDTLGVVPVPVAALLAPPLLELGAAAAPAIPAAAPPAAKAPATIVAPSILDTFTSRPPLGGGSCVSHRAGRSLAFAQLLVGIA